MRRARVVVPIVALLVLAAVVLVATRDTKTDEQKIQAALVQCSKGARYESTARILRLLDEKYADDMGNSRLSLQTHLRGAFIGKRAWEVHWTTVQVTRTSETELDTEILMHVTELEEDRPVRRFDAPLTVTFVRRGRHLKVLYVSGLRAAAEEAEGAYGW